MSISQAREADLVARQERAAERVARQMDELVPAVAQTPHLLATGTMKIYYQCVSEV